VVAEAKRCSPLGGGRRAVVDGFGAPVMHPRHCSKGIFMFVISQKGIRAYNPPRRGNHV
jgi:hypothetical protein